MSEVPCKKRDDYLEWPEYFMAVAFLSAQRSKDPNSQVGACIVNAENKIVGIGYNGMPNGCSDDLLPWRRTAESKLDTKYPYAVEPCASSKMTLSRTETERTSMRWLLKITVTPQTWRLEDTGCKERLFTCGHSFTQHVPCQALCRSK
ncbi:deoxycytidylate deaminase-like isoform X2 [Leptonychotes weddellii]|uniref:dCMP deaminase n=1 Tax=Leptonychotes weddellii TaxID=9713 RepID=A0A2U3Y893_LEPWE|nr:deoxycytidylate deaminase-like isoform X2 [Leptonychotes weddellii]